MNAYKKMRDRHQREVNEFPMFFAFNDRQFAEGMAKLGLNPNDIEAIYKLGDTGGYYRRSDAPQFHEMFERHIAEMQEAINADKFGNGFIFDMFCYELANHEYNYTGDISDTLNALDLTEEDINGNESLRRGLNSAVKEQTKGGFE
jgi:hypothetical protein